MSEPSAPPAARPSVRRPAAPPADPPEDHFLQGWRQACAIHDEWLAHGLSAEPARRPAAEAAITELYLLAGAPAPQFTWVASPRAALAAVSRPGPSSWRLRADSLPARGADWPAASRLASLASALRADLDARIERQLPGPLRRRSPWQWDTTDPVRLLRSGVTLAEILQAAGTDWLGQSLAGARRGVAQALADIEPDAQLPLAWHGQHDADWVGYYDTWRRLGLVTLPAALGHQLGQWAALARSCGWWWPADGHCLVSERPVIAATEPAPGNRGAAARRRDWQPGTDEWHSAVRLHRADGPALEFGDGWGVHAWHGTLVPPWVVTGPAAERISREPNAEVRRCAIEHLGWDRYVDQAGLRLVAAAPDPGNPGCELQLYDLPRPWRAPARVLLAVNGSAERDGRRRRYGLAVPADLEDPVAAAGWSYGLPGPLYAQLARRT